MSRGYWRGADGFVIVYSVTDKSSFDRVNKWLDDVAQFKNDAIILLVASKIDMSRQRVVSTADGENLARNYGII